MPSPDPTKLTGRRPSERKKKWMRETRECAVCQKSYLPKRYQQKYCSPECRDQYWRGQKRWLPDPETVKEETLREFLTDYLRMVQSLPDHGSITFEW